MTRDLPPPTSKAPGGAFDSHAHFGEDFREVLARAREAGVAGLVAVGADERANAFALAAAREAPDFARLALGFDAFSGVSPGEAEAWLRSTPPLAAIGEIGLDGSRPGGVPLATQRLLFERQLALADEWRLPVIVHSRAAEADTLAALRAASSSPLAAEGRLGVLHCFVGDAAFAEAVLSLGMMVSLSGIVTFRNAESLRRLAVELPADRLLVETDSPYLAPVPLRGRVNEPAFVVHTLRLVASLRGVPVDELADQTRRNAERLFGPPRPSSASSPPPATKK